CPAVIETPLSLFLPNQVPLAVEEINSAEHPVKVGLSDAFMALVNTPRSPEARRRTIYEYHRVEVDTTKITNHSAFEFSPLPTCLQHRSCELCLSSTVTSGCGWCNILQRWNRPAQTRVAGPRLLRGTSADPPSPLASFHAFWAFFDAISPNRPKRAPAKTTPQESLTGAPQHTGIIAGVVAAVVLLVALTLLALYYINTHPTVAPPFYLMQRRTNNYWPSMKFRNQGCHNSYAEVEVGGHEKEGFIEAEQC
ncbi:hypothetical protein Z043_122134, partial [Scleropages formosus]